VFTKILVANRGEIACRIIRSCRSLGVRTVAVYSDADAHALHVRLADEAVRLGEAPSRESYLQVARLVEAARSTGAQAIHPGYGFLSENAGFAEACAAAGIVFIGPTVAAIRAMGSKSAAKQLMEVAGVPLVPGYHGEAQDIATLQAAAGRIGYPVLIKATAGGGGKGMRVVRTAAEFADALDSCQRESRASFGDDRVLIEKYLERPRHIEVQVFGDTQGSVVSLFERDCSAQRRHQKVVEEAPAPNLPGEVREAMAKAARSAAAAVAYVGAGTIEFIVDQSGDFYFMEMNTRLQVEHPVTELITGLDLVEWQLRVAAGQPLPLRQEQVQATGHSIEVRLYAEEPGRGFLPSIGRLAHLSLPAATPHVRVDAGVEAGDEVGPHYDPMLAKLITWDATRAGAIERMQQALAEVEVVGVGNNVAFLRRLTGHPQFRAGTVDTGLIERAGDELLLDEGGPGRPVLAAAALNVLLRERAALAAARAATADPHSPWGEGDGFRLNDVQRRTLAFQHGEARHALQVEYTGSGWRLDGEPLADGTTAGERPGRLAFELGGQRLRATVVAHDEQLHVFMAGRHVVLVPEDLLAHAGEAHEQHGGLRAPMPGLVIALSVPPGVDVQKGDALLVMEAMKMEHTLRAPAAGRVQAFLCAVGEQVKEGAELLEFEAAP
jgi:3-methylcrotonyl-CoA carboxylase alpha subunit